jgi:phosphate transport system protein
MARDHIVRSFDEELDELRSTIQLMGRCAEGWVDDAMKALAARNSGAPENMGANDDPVHECEHRVDRLTVRLLALRQPVGEDLRTVVSALKIDTDLRRIADYAVEIAVEAKRLVSPSLPDPMDAVKRMGDMARAMLGDILRAYDSQAAGMAVDVWHSVEQLEKVYTQLLIQLRVAMKEDAGNIDPCTSLIHVGRCLDRIGNHIRSIAEQIYFIVMGEEFLSH